MRYIDERHYPIGSHYIGSQKNPELIYGFGIWEFKARTTNGKYLYERVG